VLRQHGRKKDALTRIEVTLLPPVWRESLLARKNSRRGITGSGRLLASSASGAVAKRRTTR